MLSVCVQTAQFSSRNVEERVQLLKTKCQPHGQCQAPAPQPPCRSASPLPPAAAAPALQESLIGPAG